MARVRHTFLNKSELYCARAEHSTAIISWDVWSERCALGKREGEVGIGYVRWEIRNEEKRIVKVGVWFRLSNYLVCLRVTWVRRHRRYREENVEVYRAVLVDFPVVA